MRIPAEALSGSSVRDKIVPAAEAVRLIRDGDSVVVEGFVGQCFAEELTLALEQRFLLTGTPRDLGLVFTMAAGDRRGRGRHGLGDLGGLVEFCRVIVTRVAGNRRVLGCVLLGGALVVSALHAHRGPFVLKL